MEKKVRTLVFNGWAAGREAWSSCTFPHDRIFDYLEELDGVPARVVGDLDDIVSVGFSMGGSMALDVFLRYPGKVRGLVLVSATACMMDHPDEGWKGMSPRRREALLLGTKMVCGTDGDPLYAEANLRRGLDYLTVTDQRAALTDACARGVTRDLPVSIVQSERDGIVRPHNAEFLKTVFPQAEITWVPGNEHTLPVSAPEAVDAAVARVQARAGADTGGRT